MRRLEWTFNGIHVVQSGLAQPRFKPIKKSEQSVSRIPFHLTLVEAYRRGPNNMRETSKPIVQDDEARNRKREIWANYDDKFLAFAKTKPARFLFDSADAYAERNIYVPCFGFELSQDLEFPRRGRLDSMKL